MVELSAFVWPSENMVVIGRGGMFRFFGPTTWSFDSMEREFQPSRRLLVYLTFFEKEEENREKKLGSC